MAQWLRTVAVFLRTQIQFPASHKRGLPSPYVTPAPGLLASTGTHICGHAYTHTLSEKFKNKNFKSPM